MNEPERFYFSTPFDPLQLGLTSDPGILKVPSHLDPFYKPEHPRGELIEKPAPCLPLMLQLTYLRFFIESEISCCLFGI